MQLTKAQFKDCQEAFLKLGENGLYLNHYQLAMETNIPDPLIWKAFLTEPKTVDYIQTEMNVIRTATINEIVQKASDSRSVGQAQLINALAKLDENATKKEGPAFIYSYVPLNSQQKYAPNVKEVNADGSEIEEEEWNLDDIIEPSNLSTGGR